MGEGDVGVAADYVVERHALEDSHVLDAAAEFGQEHFRFLAELEVGSGADADARGSRLE